MKIRNRLGFISLALLLLLLCVVAWGGFLFAHATTEATASITSFTVSKEKTNMQIDATLHGISDNTLVYLFALSPENLSQPLDSQIPISTARSSSQTAQFRFYISGNHRHRIYMCYQLALQNEDGSYLPLGDARYLDAPEMLAVVTDPYPQAISKKGLQTQLYTDAQLLGVSHTIVPIAINELISEKPSDYSFVYLNQTYYLNQSEMELLDYKIRRLSQSGIRVYLNLLLTAPSETSALLSHLYYSTDSAQAQFFAYNFENETSAHLLQGLITYLTERYTRPDHAYGFAASFIVGYEVNASRYRNYRGFCNLNEYAASYARLVRMVYTASRSVYAHSRIYISIANNWNTPAFDSSVTVNPLLDYSSSEFLSAFQNAMDQQGTPFAWSVAINPYPSDVRITDFWNDPLAPAALDAPYLTMNNLEVLTNLLATERYRFDGEPRTVLVSEFGVSGQLGTESEALQAAAFAYAYYKSFLLSGVEAMIWHRQVDRIGEVDLYFGLWSSDYSDILAPVTKKQIYSIFRYIDSNRLSLANQESLTAFAPPLIGVQGWEELFAGFRESDAKVQNLYETVPSAPQANGDKLHSMTIYDFSENMLYSFTPSDSARYLETRPDPTYGYVLYSSLYPTNPTEYAGISSYPLTPISIAGQSHIQLIVKAAHGNQTDPVSPDLAQGTVTLMLRMAGTDENGVTCTYEGVAQINANAWSTVTFPISAFSDTVSEINVIKIWIRGHKAEASTSTNECFISLASVSLLTSSRFSMIRVLITIIASITIPVTILLISYLISLHIRTVLRRNKKKHHRHVRDLHRYHLSSHEHRDPDHKKKD